MALVQLPDYPAPRTVQWMPQDFGGTQTSSLGGTAQRINRLGNRWSCAVELPPMPIEQAMEWTAAITSGLSNGVSYALRQMGTPVLVSGSPLVNGAAQAGNTVALDGFTEGHVAHGGRFFAIVTGGQRYIYQVASTTASASGAYTALPINPALRVAPADNDVVEFEKPTIEGLLEDVPSWAITPDYLMHGFSFTINEAR